MNREIVVCAAVKTTSGKIIRGHRHSDCLSAIYDRRLRPNISYSAQGFITSKNRFVDRAEGRELQDESDIKSVNKGGYKGHTLFSEDLY